MNIEEIEKFVSNYAHGLTGHVKISFKQREPVYGLFVKDKDYAHLKSKNFWRIVPKMHLDDFRQSKDMSLARIFNGASFTRLMAYAESLE